MLNPIRHLTLAGILILIPSWSARAKVVIFWQPNFPTVESQPVPQETLRKVFDGMQPVFAGVDELAQPATLKGADLLVLPYGSAFPVDDWNAVAGYLDTGGNLLNLGGRPFFIPVSMKDGKPIEQREQASYAQSLGIAHSYVAPQSGEKFIWDDGYSYLGEAEVHAQKVFVLATNGEGGAFGGIGYLLGPRGERVSAPVVKDDFVRLRGHLDMLGARCVLLNFDPEPGYWASDAAIRLVRASADYALQGATEFWLEMQQTTLLAGEAPQVVVHLRNVRRQREGFPQQGRVKLELLSGKEILQSKDVECSGDTVQQAVAFSVPSLPGLYSILGTYENGGAPRESYETGFWVGDRHLLDSGPALGVGKTYFTLDGAPFLPFGANYFTTDRYYQGFFGGGNAYVWDRDFAEMEAHGVTFIRTGIWNSYKEIIGEGGATERFLRNLEAFLLCANRHHIQAHFTFFAFDPQTLLRHPGEDSLLRGPGTNPYTDRVAIRAQQNYLVSVVTRFKDVPYLSWDLINEPSFSNPLHLWKGNTPNDDPTERAAWNRWLESRYGGAARIANAWGVTPEEVGRFGAIPLPSSDDLTHTRNGNGSEIRAFDYNLFAQEMFDRWVSQMVSAIHSAGSNQLVTVGQDEGGVTDRLLTQFYGGAGANFTVNHTYWQDDALLWDSVVAKRVGMPNLIGETGIQPVWNVDGSWRWDEVTGLGLFERKMALGFAAANSGALMWEWGVGDDFGIKRSDGSEKIWETVLAGMGDFAKRAVPYATGERPPEVAIVLPQSLQLSVMNAFALEATQTCVRALFLDARASAYAVGEYQIELLGEPRLIILPSPWTLSEKAWEVILAKARAGATLLVSGRFDLDPYFHATGRERQVGIDYRPAPLVTRENLLRWPGGEAWLTYSGAKTTYLDRTFLPGGVTFIEKPLGQGRILYSALPLELNNNLRAVGEVYRLALHAAGVTPTYTTELQDPGILICPTRLGNATLYVLASESSQDEVAFRDTASSKEFRGRLDSGRAALLLVSHQGELLTSYNWHSEP